MSNVGRNQEVVKKFLASKAFDFAALGNLWPKTVRASQVPKTASLVSSLVTMLFDTAYRRSPCSMRE
jgi:hypothetical protein